MAALVEKSVTNLGFLIARGSTSNNFHPKHRLFAGESGRLPSFTRSSSVLTAGRVGGPVQRSWTRIRASKDAEPDDSPPNSEQQKSPYLTTNNPGFLNVQESNFFKPPKATKGWDDPRLLAQLRSLAVIADDRAEMHSAVAIQRDNWGKLIQVTVSMSMISAGILSALNTRSTTGTMFSLSLTSALLSAGSIIFMGLQNWFQPSQLAEEQRAATRFLKNLVNEIETSLKPGGAHLKEEAKLFYESKVQKLKYLDRAFPLPLFPGGLDKFPKYPGPSVLSAPVDTNEPEVTPTSEDLDNGWSSSIVEDLKRTSELLKKSDIATYSGWQKNALKINKFLAISGPVLAFLSIIANFVGGQWGSVVAAGCCVMAGMISSFSHDAQVGMIYEMYRDVAGTFLDMDKEIHRNLRLPVNQREDGELFHQKIALQLGRREGEAIVSSEDQPAAGTLL
ncbi:unnamed protein product [Calypogeia fissa]